MTITDMTPTEIFEDPIAYLTAFGIDAELVSDPGLLAAA